VRRHAVVIGISITKYHRRGDVVDFCSAFPIFLAPLPVSIRLCLSSERLVGFQCLRYCTCPLVSLLVLGHMKAVIEQTLQPTNQLASASYAFANRVPPLLHMPSCLETRWSKQQFIGRSNIGRSNSLVEATLVEATSTVSVLLSKSASPIARPPSLPNELSLRSICVRVVLRASAYLSPVLPPPPAYCHQTHSGRASPDARRSSVADPSPPSSDAFRGLVRLAGE
jgi:hypothetical protein